MKKILVFGISVAVVLVSGFSAGKVNAQEIGPGPHAVIQVAQEIEPGPLGVVKVANEVEAAPTMTSNTIVGPGAHAVAEV